MSRFGSRWACVVLVVLGMVGVVAPVEAKETPDAPAAPTADLGAPVIDDAAIVKAFQKHAETLAGRPETVTPKKLREQLKKCSNKSAVKLPAASDFAASPDELYEKCGRSIVAIGSAYKCDKCTKWHMGTAAGYVVTRNGVAVTNYHVMDDDEGAVVMAINRDMEVFPVTAVLAADEKADIAVIQLGDGKSDSFCALPVAPHARVGEPVTIISHPDDHYYVLTRGVASRFALAEESGSVPWLCVTAEYAKGSSGAPVLNDKGQVVGMVSSTESIYYDDNGKRQKNFQMVMRYCVSSSSIVKLFKRGE
ncbi:MAG: hypothetical protein GC159_04865 [Phycisphaera sp.]|nr:hypothetical protein [Phycisphaera sp.]